MKKHSVVILSLFVISIIVLGAVATNIDDFFLPGSQPGQSGNIESPNKCDNCHGGYNQAVEPAFNWRGSMMAQAARDPLYFACLAIANQDAPESGDLCIRCHAPDGWLNGRSIPTDGSALNDNDREGVQCDFCHKLVQPSLIGVNPYPDDADYTAGTFTSDQDYLAQLTIIPPQSGNGMYIAHSANAKRGPFVDAEAKHKMNYSPFHSESDICATCHDVSNPVYTRNADGTYSPNPLGSPSPDFNTYMMLPVERTYSEWKMSAFNTPEGVPSDVFGGNKANVSTCQDCHMRDVSGYGANKKGIPYRTDLPLHDMTGGNTFIPDLVAHLYPDEVDHAALDAGKARALAMLKSAATVELTTTTNANDISAEVTVTNNTGHKLPSGYPEGRRIWINLKAYDIDGILLYESGAYDTATAELTKTGTKIYEIKLGMSEEIAAAASADGIKTYTPGESFHFVLNDLVVKDNRIPPMGFTNANFDAIQSPVVEYSYDDGQHWDNTTYLLPLETFHIKVQLLYQTVSKEYVEFLRDENRTNDAGNILYNLWELYGKSAPVVMNEVDYYAGEVPVKLMSVANTTFTRNSAKGGKTYVSAQIQVVDEDSNPVADALVSGTFNGPTNNSTSGVTDQDGICILNSTATKRVSGIWCLDITDVSKSGYEFTGPVQYCEASFKQSSTIDEPIASKLSVSAYPNPSEDNITIKFNLAKESLVKAAIYNMAGVKVADVVNSTFKTGIHDLPYDVSSLTKGQYIIKMVAGEQNGIVIITVN